MGTPDFAVESLRQLVENDYNIVGVVTAPDKAAGRGQKLSESAVKQYATSCGLPILQPEKLKDESFLLQLADLKADLQIVVAFRMLPEVVWKMSHLGTFNLHASLLPHYRGAAPINHAIINGETETGITTFFIDKELDTGKVIFQEKVLISENETAGELHDKLMFQGAKLVVKTVQAIENNDFMQLSQELLISDISNLKSAPKIYKNDCKIDWKKGITDIHNKIRGLSPYPAAWCELKNIRTNEIISAKIYETRKVVENHKLNIGEIVSDNRTFVKVATFDGFAELRKIQLAGKRCLEIAEFLRGFDINSYKLIV